MKYGLTDSPDFMKTLVVYEIATKGYTSPDGPESGTFKSLTDKMDYLRQLGINGIWLSGHQLCASPAGKPWTQYGCIRPDRIDTSLGTEEDFKVLVGAAHEHGILMFVDVITHGVMPESDLIKEHPNWFKGGSWGMVDFDWFGNHPDLDEWWINTWVSHVTEYSIDGFRLGVTHYRSDLWALIRKRCAEEGHPVMVMMECGPAVTGVSDTLQFGDRLSDNLNFHNGHRILKDAAGHFLDRQFSRTENYMVEIHYKDGSVQSSFLSTNDGRKNFTNLLQIEYNGTFIRHIDNEEYKVGYEEEIFSLRLENVQRKYIDDLVVFDSEMHAWHSNKNNTLLVDYYVEICGEAPSLKISCPLRQQKGQYMSVQLSSHDNGWEGYEGNNAFAAKGSRHVMGYGCLLAPAIPVFMSGEEFNVDYRPIPDTVFPGASPGYDKQLWLYANWLDWDQLEKPEKKAMLEDVRKILAIKKKNSGIIRVLRMGMDNNVSRLPYRSCDILPIPYIYVENNEAIIVAANPNTEKAAELSFKLTDVLEYGEKYRLVSLFGPEACYEGATEELAKRFFRIEKDLTAGGGLLVLKLSKIDE